VDHRRTGTAPCQFEAVQQLSAVQMSACSLLDSAKKTETGSPAESKVGGERKRGQGRGCTAFNAHRQHEKEQQERGGGGSMYIKKHFKKHLPS
jgi:hypothetical protein